MVSPGYGVRNQEIQAVLEQCQGYRSLLDKLEFKYPSFLILARMIASFDIITELPYYS